MSHDPDNRCTFCLQWGHKAHNCPRKRAPSIAALALALSLAAPQAHACKDTLRFTRDKQQHMAVSAVMSAAVGTVTKDPALGFWAAVAAGALKEAYDAQHRDKHCASAADFAYDVAGAWLGYQASGWMIQALPGGVKLTYTTNF